MSDFITPGTVWLVGAGPGDPDLMTRKAEKLIAAADIVFYDALVGSGILDLIPATTERISVGKRAGRHSKEQSTINDLMFDAAIRGLRVVRLKGGDPSIFGRSAEEVESLAAKGITVRICPGITAASAAAASAGMSLTLRGEARKLIFVTAHTGGNKPLDIDWGSSVDPKATLAIYMGKSMAGPITSKLMSHNMPADTPALVVENASLPDERIIHTRLDRLAQTIRVVAGSGPLMIILGTAVKPQHHRTRSTATVVTS